MISPSDSIKLGMFDVDKMSGGRGEGKNKKKEEKGENDVDSIGNSILRHRKVNNGFSAVRKIAKLTSTRDRMVRDRRQKLSLECCGMPSRFPFSWKLHGRVKW